MHDPEVGRHVDPLLGQGPHVWMPVDVATVLVLEHDDQHVIERGYTRPAYIGYAAETYWDADREAGFRVGLARCGVPGDGAGVTRVSDDASARAQIGSFLASARPDAVLTGVETRTSSPVRIISSRVKADTSLLSSFSSQLAAIDLRPVRLSPSQSHSKVARSS